MSDRPKIAVVGSLNIDSTYLVSQIPVRGETTTSTRVEKGRGGKGANQAVAARRAGGEVSLIGCVGDDEAGRGYVAALADEGINVSMVSTARKTSTGSAVICVEDSGENLIIVDPGANHALGAADILAMRSEIESADVLLVQLECPAESVRTATEIARAAGVTIVVNPSPWSDDFEESGILYDYLILNETEAMQLLGDELSEATIALSEKKLGGSLVITRGSRSTLFLDDSHCAEEEAMKVTPIDTVGAGDTFAGAFSLAIAEGRSLRESIRFGNRAGAIATQQLGAQTSIPSRREIDTF